LPATHPEPGQPYREAGLFTASRPDPFVDQRAPTSIAMTRSDLVAALAERFATLTQKDTEFAVKTMLDAMSDALARGHRIEIRGFGSFSINRRPPRLGRNPRSGEQVPIPEKLVPHFKPGKALREGVDQSAPADGDKVIDSSAVAASAPDKT
jgi:integration host factor subunit beta